jgi:hypothetical protein
MSSDEDSLDDFDQLPPAGEGVLESLISTKPSLPPALPCLTPLPSFWDFLLRAIEYSQKTLPRA